MKNNKIQQLLSAVDKEIIDIELQQRNEKHFKHWAKRWYHRYHELPVKKSTYPVQS